MKETSLHLLFGEKGAQLCETLLQLHRRLPRFFPRALVFGLGGFLSNCSALFLSKRSRLALSRIFLSKFWAGERARALPSQQIHLKVLRYDPSLFGVMLAVTSLKEGEIFNEAIICKGIQNLVPGVKPVSDSFLEIHESGTLFFYLELKKIRGGFFTLSEQRTLTAYLHLELLQDIQSLSRSLFFPGNEEDLLKNIRHLSHELRFVGDLPQVMITFVEYSKQTLKFLVIALRLLKPETVSIASKTAHLPSTIHFSLENVLLLDRLRNKYLKEASIFTLEVDSSLFLRHNRAVNLRTARRYVVRSLENMLGPLRDYNGGFLDQENQQLLKAKETLAKEGIYCEFLDDLFYGIKPIALRPTLSLRAIHSLVTLFQSLSAYHLPSEESHYLATGEHIAMVKSRQLSWKQTLPPRILGHSFQFGCTCIEDDGFLYLCFFDSSSQGHLVPLLEKELRRIATVSPESNRSILNLNFQAGDPSSLNPRLAADIHSHILSNFLFEGLTQLTRAGTIEPAAAETIEASPSGTCYTFHLRPSWWSNGEAVTAYQFEHAWKRALMAKSAGCLRTDFFYPIKNARRARDTLAKLSEVGIFAPNAKTLLVELEAPCPYFLNLLAMPLFFPLYGEGEEPTVFNGPFALTEWVRGEHLSLSQNPFYWDSSRIRLSGIFIRMISDAYQAYRLFQKGGLDLIGDPISPLPPELLKKPRIRKQLRYKEISRVFWIHCNLRTFPLHNANLRRALSLALNRQQFIDKVFIDQIPQLSPLPPKYSQCSGPVENRERARALFKQALEELGLDRLPDLVVTHSDLSFEAELFNELRLQLKQALGIHLIALPLPWSAFSSALEKGDFQLAGLFRRDLFNDPLFYLSFFRSAPNNSLSWENKEYEELLRLIVQDPKNPDNYKKIEQLFIENAPVLPLINQRYLLLTQPRVKNLDWNENGCINLKEASIYEKTTPLSPLLSRRLPNRRPPFSSQKTHS